MRSLGLLALWVALVGCLVGVRPPPAPSRNPSLGLSISTLTLPNGLRVVIVSDPRAAEVQVTMRYQVGAVDDPSAQGGMAHLVEHLMFEQTVDDVSVSRRLASVATYYNAQTTLDATTYIARAHPSKLRDLLSIEALRLRSKCSGISNAHFGRERDVVLNEIRYRDRARQILAALGKVLFAEDHPYRRQVAGGVDSVAAITREQACAFAEARYAPGNAVLVVSGNLARAQVEEALTADLAHVPARTFSSPIEVPSVRFTPGGVETTAPVERAGLVLVWPRPSEPKLQARYRALIAAAAELASSRVNGSAVLFEPDGVRTGMIGMVLSAGEGETDAELVNAAAHGLRTLPELLDVRGIREFEKLGFNRTRHGALYRLFAGLDDAMERDPELATYVAQGLDPNAVVQARMEGLRELTRDEAIQLSRQLKYDAAKVVTLKPSQKQAGQRLPLTSNIAESEDERVPTDPQDAQRPAPTTITTHVAGGKTRKLRNGLSVILLPNAASPIVDVRLVFQAGTADEPATKRGVAVLAARALDFDERHIKDVLAFVAAGGDLNAKVAFDRTTFAVRGMSSELDFLLAGLRRLVREGTYHPRIDWFTHVVKRARRKDTAATDAWRKAVFGTEHPYAKAGLLHHTADTLTADDAAAFRASHYTPDNATVIITGNFDPAVADRWIDYLFADWDGHTTARAAPSVSFEPAAFAMIDNESHVDLGIAFPATAQDHATRLVVTQMLSRLAGNVRYQLGASYDASAELTEGRLFAWYAIAMEVDATRAPAAAKLLAEDIAKLRTDPEFAARTFVAARQSVLARLASLGDSATRLADRVEHDVELGRDVMATGTTAESVRTLTIDQMTAALADLSLSRAVISMRGPGEIKEAFAALGRVPLYIAVPRAPDAAEEEAAADEAKAGDSYTDARPISNALPSPVVLADPLTAPSSPFRVAYTLAAGASFARMERQVSSVSRSASYSGPRLAGAFGYRRRSSIRVGAELGFARLEGTTTGTDPKDISFLALDLGPYFQARLQGPFWFGAMAAVRFEHDSKLHVGGQLGATIGLDLVPIKVGLLALFARYERVRMPDDLQYGEITLSVALRR